MNVLFANAWVLFFLWLVPAVGMWWYLAHQRRKRDWDRFVSPAMQKKLCPARSSAQTAWQSALVLAGLFFLLVAAARPQWGTQEVTVYQRGRDLMILLDVSRSMLADDVHPNRLQRAKTDLLDLIKELKGDRAGLMAFRFKAILLCPLTTDYAFLRHALDSVDIGSAPAGETDIGDAIEKALDAFDEREGSHKAIILISDGEDLSGRAVEAAKKAGEKGIPIFTVGLGSTQGSKIPQKESGATGFVAYQGQEVVTKMDHETLLAMAEASKGAHISIGTASTSTMTLGALYRSFRQKIAEQENEETLQRRRIERYQIFLLPAVLLLLAGAFLSRGRLALSARAARQAPAPAAPPPAGAPPLRDLNPERQPLKNIAALLLAVGLAPAGLRAQTNAPAPAEPATNAPPAAVRPAAPGVPPGREGARQAQALYAIGRYAEAAAAYLAAAQGATGKSRRDFQYNAALAYYQAGQYADAARVLKDLEMSTPETDPATAAALGAAYYRDAGLRKGEDSTNLVEKARLVKEAADAFRRASRSETDNADSRHNLALALEQLPELEEQAKIARLLAQHGQTPPPQLAARLLAEQRQVIEQAARAFTNSIPQQVKTLEALAEKQKAAADLWIPLKGKLLQALQQQGGGTNQNQLAQLNQIIEATRDSMQSAASKLRDLEPESLDAASRSEAATYGLWKGIAPFDLVLQEDLLVQTNALARTASKLASTPEPPLPPRPEQEEALTLTRLFAERFAQSVPESGLSAPPAPGQPPTGPQAEPPDAHAPPSTNQLITAETRRKILELADEAAAAQDRAIGLLNAGDRARALPEQTRAYERLREIEKLLPKQQPEQQPQEQPPNPDQQPQPQQQKPDDEQEQKPPEQKEEPKDQTPEDVKRLLEKALQREQEHEAEKRRERQYPMSPRDKDW